MQGRLRHRVDTDLDLAEQTGVRADVDHRPTPSLERREARLRVGETPSQVDGHDGVEIRQRGRERRGLNADARVVHQDVHAAEQPDRLGDRSLDLCLVRGVGPDEPGAAVRSQLPFGRAAQRRVTPGDDHAGTLPNERPGDREAQPRCPSRDQRGPVVKLAHRPARSPRDAFDRGTIPLT